MKILLYLLTTSLSQLVSLVVNHLLKAVGVAVILASTSHRLTRL